MSLRKQIEFQLRVARRIRKRRFFGLFIGLALPTMLMLSALIGWHNSILGDPTTADVVLRSIVILVAMAAIGVLVFCWAILPAIREERCETGRLTNRREHEGEEQEDSKRRN
ncbi:MAG: hypothetical protein WD847_20510 [Pirellulales bacterium]